MRTLFSMTATAVAFCCFSSSVARAQGADSGAIDLHTSFAGRWVPARESRALPLQRRVRLELTGARLQDALQAIARQAGLKLGYSGDVPRSPVRISLKSDGLTVLAALTQVLEGTGFEPFVSLRGDAVLVAALPAAPPPTGSVVGRVTDAKTGAAIAGATVMVEGAARSASSGNDGRYRVTEVPPGTYTVRARYIGYAPGSTSASVSADQDATADFALEKSAQRLDEVVTTGTVVPTEVKALPTPISVVSSEDIQRKNFQRVDQVFRGDVPGATAWDLGPFDYFSSISVRGATQLSGQGSLKTFIDGVEVANPTFVATIDPNSIDRIEITRGPQASTLYGAGALNGVMQIFTKKESAGLARPEITAKLSAGGVGGFDGQSTALQTDNALSVLGGNQAASYNLGGSYGHIGDWVPTYGSTDWGAWAGGQTTQGPLTLSSSLRYNQKTFDYPWDTRFRSYTVYSQPYYETFRLRQQTYGVTATLRATRSWQHTLTVGYDQSYLDFDQTQPRLTTPADSLLVAFTSHSATTSLLYHTDLSVQLGAAVAAVLTGGINYDSYDFVSSYTFGATTTTGGLDGVHFDSRTPSHNAGYFGQAQLNIAERVFLIGGLRAERNPNFGTDFGTAWSPRVGASYLVGVGPASVKLRVSYGESILAPTLGQREAQRYPTYQYLANPVLAPERQRGVDAGLDIYIGRASLGVTYYNQRAIDLIQSVTLPTAPGTLVTYQNQNVGRVKNEGWEFEGRLPLGPVQISGTYSITNATVKELPPGYTGDYQAGDRIIGIPHTLAGATISCSPLPQTTLTADMTYIGHWIESDWIALYGFYYGGQAYRGSGRAYWMQYPSVTKFGIGVTQELSKTLSAFVRATNVGNTLRYEQNNSQIPMPRSLVVGANVRY